MKEKACVCCEVFIPFEVVIEYKGGKLVEDGNCGGSGG
jgi:hypothetical protein